MNDTPNKKLFSLTSSSAKAPLRQKMFSLVGGTVEKVLAIDQINHIYYTSAESKTPDEHFADRILETMRVQYDVTEADMARIPKSGPVVVVANHPFGGLEGLILASILKTVRPDVKLMANFLLERIPDLRDFFIFVDPFGRAESAKSNIKPLKETMAWLRAGGMLGVFPAGEVSHIDIRKGGIVDPTWSPTIARIVKKTGAPVLPVYFVGSNSLTFQLLGLVHPRLRTAMLPHEFINKSNRTIHARIGSLIPHAKLADLDEAALMDYIRMRTYHLKDRKKEKGQKKRVWSLPVRIAAPKSEMTPVVEAEPPEMLIRELASLAPEHKLLESGGLSAYFAYSRQIPHILREIGRLREITFREVNEGTGSAIDLDRFDDYYIHVFIWSEAKQEVVGAYRLGKTDVILEQLGKRGLYTSTLFKYRKKLLKRISPALEMGRSFIRKEYQRNYSSLLMLWKGLAHYIARHPDYKILFGPVSINSEYQSLSRQLLVGFLKQNESLPDLAKLVKPRKPMRMNPIKKWKLRKMRTSVKSLDEVESLIGDIETDLTGIPILLRQYLRLGGKLLAFNIDPDFSYVLDGLILVDLTKTDAKVMERYMGREQTRQFLAHHGINPSTSHG
ncbi:MAG TPA: GNAT family N-acyltransferase [Kiritimatiellia bacterium]|nr:GNAT family N-acyltransferase [Kiritimatiellia bacterium]HMO99401.1 GNAT family N-acyltransferase [Kiritimatiellia bacterium]HMP97612.1 GNAT family N-acyltransferase [Kiritimatiellia bacterium]